MVRIVKDGLRRSLKVDGAYAPYGRGGVRVTVIQRKTAAGDLEANRMPLPKRVRYKRKRQVQLFSCIRRQQHRVTKRMPEPRTQRHQADQLSETVRVNIHQLGNKISVRRARADPQRQS